MGMMKRHLENEVARISRNSGYSKVFIMDVCMELLEDEGEIDLKMVEDTAMEHDF